jgi:hypothetical protein
MTCAADRTHKLFIITSSGCGNLADKFYNYSVDIRGSTMSTEDVMESEEAYYLRRVCGRNNARILQMVADEMGLCIPSVVDTCAYDLCSIASCTTETMINEGRARICGSQLRGHDARRELAPVLHESVRRVLAVQGVLVFSEPCVFVIFVCALLS